MAGEMFRGEASGGLQLGVFPDQLRRTVRKLRTLLQPMLHTLLVNAQLFFLAGGNGIEKA